MSKILDTLYNAIKATCKVLRDWWVKSDQKWRDQQTTMYQACQAENTYYDMNYLQKYLFICLHKANLDTIKPLKDVTNIIIRDEISNPYSNKYVFELSKENVSLTQTRKMDLIRTMQSTIKNVSYIYFQTPPNTSFVTINHIEDYGSYILIYVSIT